MTFIRPISSENLKLSQVNGLFFIIMIHRNATCNLNYKITLLETCVMFCIRLNSTENLYKRFYYCFSLINRFTCLMI